ncbi:LOW QUALITY PROTEIN: hypothetical protein V1477_005763 [Vespula maculifrons]|uniref:Uncharacterized protein n=1 Tax=Vespula maculifrons TaxID=7453 RepID=A0ABD2CM07_VESMC
MSQIYEKAKANSIARNIIWNIKSHIEAEECFKRQLKILTKEGTSLAIVHVCIMKRKKKKIHTCLTTKFRKTNIAMFYKASNKGTRKWVGFIFFKASNSALAGGYKRLCSTSFVEEPSDVPCERAICFTRSFDTKRVQLRKSLLCFMIACSLHKISLHRTRRTRVPLQTSPYHSL